VLGLAVFGSLHWMRLLEPAAPFRAWEAVGIAVLTIAGLAAAARIERNATRRAAASGVALLAAVLALLAAGLADEYLRPDRWGALAAGIIRGLEVLPGARVPFRGLDEWTRMVLALGGTGLVTLAAALALWPRARGRTGVPAAALAALVTLYIVPTVALDFEQEFLRGALLVVLLIAFWRLERLRPAEARPAGLAALAVAVLALGVAPVLDRQGPWWDYEAWALSAATSKTTAFTWDHNYGPLDWPRDGRELLRVRARQDAYWKAENLDVFDGSAWQRSYFSDAPNQQMPGASADPRSARKWTQRIRVSVRNLSSREVIAAGVVKDAEVRPRGTLVSAPGILVTAGRPLRRGDVYTAEVYSPEPSPEQLRLAGTRYEMWLDEYRTIGISSPGELPGRPQQLRFPPYSSSERAPRIVERRYPGYSEPGGEELAASDMARVAGLAQRLKARSSTPYGFVRQVEAYLRDGFSYTERPPAAAGTLPGFLLDAKQGFCQQYSGAMALLLRMGGVPARVAAGFTPGSLDAKTGEFVVRDLDAHSWVEAWFPGYGWVTFDPTPSAAPPRSQSDDVSAAAAAVAGDLPNIGLPSGVAGPRTAPAVIDEGTSWKPIAGGGAAAVGLLGLVLVGWRRRRRSAGPRDDWRESVAELERALRRVGRTPAPGLTLRALEAGFASSPGAAAYVRVLREQRYRGGGRAPTPAERRRLRAELGRGAGPIGRLRAWWALPPHVTSPRR
jgi:transglutaminase-like putative cysteine protease